MWLVIWLVLLFVVVVVVVLIFGVNDGFVSFYWVGWCVDILFNFFLLLLVVSCFVFVMVI